VSHSRVCWENGLPIRQNFESKEPSPTWAGSNILSDGDPQAGYPAILVLTGNRSYLSVFTLSRLSQARGIAKKTIRGLYGARTRGLRRDRAVL
jgi:hypothetical protein